MEDREVRVYFNPPTQFCWKFSTLEECAEYFHLRMRYLKQILSGNNRSFNKNQYKIYYTDEIY